MISVAHLTKYYGSHKAVDDLSFTIEPGHIYGFLGPNGAGKSTTMNILTGCLAATEGSVTIGGNDIFEEPLKAKKRIGYLPELPPLYVDMTAKEYLRFVARAKGLKGSSLKASVEYACRATGITDVASRLIKHLSKGYRQRVGIAQALLGDPEIIILDEPTVGLDPQQIIEIRELIRELGKKHTVILSTHILPEVSAVCDRILIIAKGRLIVNEEAEVLTRSTALRVKIHAPEAQTALNALNGPEDAQLIESDGDLHTLRIPISGDIDALSRSIFRRVRESGLELSELAPERTGLEEIFLRLTGGDDHSEIHTEKEAENA